MQITKIKDVAIATKIADKIKKYQVKFIINIIINCCILPRVQLDLKITNIKTKYSLQTQKYI